MRQAASVHRNSQRARAALLALGVAAALAAPGVACAGNGSDEEGGARQRSVTASEAKASAEQLAHERRYPPPDESFFLAVVAPLPGEPPDTTSEDLIASGYLACYALEVGNQESWVERMEREGFTENATSVVLAGATAGLCPWHRVILAPSSVTVQSSRSEVMRTVG